MFNTSKNNNNNTIILELNKYSVPYWFLILSHARIQRVTQTTSKGVFIFHIPGQEYVCIGIVSSDKV